MRPGTTCGRPSRAPTSSSASRVRPKAKPARTSCSSSCGNSTSPPREKTRVPPEHCQLQAAPPPVSHERGRGAPCEHGPDPNTALLYDNSDKLESSGKRQLWRRGISDDNIILQTRHDTARQSWTARDSRTMDTLCGTTGDGHVVWYYGRWTRVVLRVIDTLCGTTGDGRVVWYYG